MNVKRFTARTSRDALGLVKQAFGQDAVVLSTRPCADGVEVLAMAPDAVAPFEAAATPAAPPAAPARTMPAAANAAATLATSAEQDAERLAMSTLSFQDYVRERMLRRRRAELGGGGATPPAAPAPAATAPAASAPAAAGTGFFATAPATAPAVPPRPAVSTQAVEDALAASTRFAAAATQGMATTPVLTTPVATAVAPPAPPQVAASAPLRGSVNLFDRISASRHEPTFEDADDLGAFAQKLQPVLPTDVAAAGDQGAMLAQLREVKQLIEERFGALAFMEKLQRDPRQARLCQRLLDIGFSPKVIRRLADNLPGGVDEMAWAGSVLERNLQTGEREPALEDTGGVFALIGPTGVGKTTGTAKLAAAFATRHGAANLGLITLDAYRVGAHEQLRAYGRILGVPVHTAHDRASLEDLLDLLSAKKMVLIDTAGMAQRDERTRELLEMLDQRAIQRLLVINAAVQGETADDVLQAYRASDCRGIVLSKMDEAVKLAPVVDALIRHRMKVLAVANGQRVPEDWHRLSASTLIQRAFNAPVPAVWQRDAEEVNLVFAGARLSPPGPAGN